MITDILRTRRSSKKYMSSNKSSTNNKGSSETSVHQVESPINSDAHRHTAELSSQVLQEPVVDNEKVKEIKAAIENGTYQVNPEAIAEKLMEMEVLIADKGKG